MHAGWNRLMIAQVVRWGNSLALRIPSAIAKTLEFEEGASVSLTLDKGRLVISPVTKTPVYDIGELARAITDDNNYSEIDFGRRVGSETW